MWLLKSLFIKAKAEIESHCGHFLGDSQPQLASGSQIWTAQAENIPSSWRILLELLFCPTAKELKKVFLI